MVARSRTAAKAGMYDFYLSLWPVQTRARTHCRRHNSAAPSGVDWVLGLPVLRALWTTARGAAAPCALDCSGCPLSGRKFGVARSGSGSIEPFVVVFADDHKRSDTSRSANGGSEKRREGRQCARCSFPWPTRLTASDPGQRSKRAPSKITVCAPLPLFGVLSARCPQKKAPAAGARRDARRRVS